MADIAQLVARIQLKGASEVTHGLNKVDAKVRETSATFQKVAGGMMLAGAAGTALGIGAFKAAVEMDSLMRGLTAVMGSAGAASAEMERLIEVAKLPGLGVKEAIAGSVALQAAGMNAELAARSLKAFGNALATVGKGKADLDMVNLALTQLMNRQSGYGQEIRQLQERLPQIRRAMIAFYGTADSEVLSKLGVTGEQFVRDMVAQFERMPKVTGGLQNSLENIDDAFLRLKASVGSSIGRIMLPALEKTADVLARIADNSKATAVTAGVLMAAPFVAVAGAIWTAILQLKAYMAMIKLASKLSLESSPAMAAPGAAAAAANAAAATTAKAAAAGSALMLGGAAAAGAAGAGATGVATGATGLVGVLGAAGLAGLIAMPVMALIYKAFVSKDVAEADKRKRGYWDVPRWRDKATGQMMFGEPRWVEGDIDKRIAMLASRKPWGAEVPSAGTVAPGLAPPQFPQFSMPSLPVSPIAEGGLKRYALGGGELGAMGISPVELGAARQAKSNRPITVRVEGGRTLEQMFADMVAQTVMQMRRQGALA